MAMEKAKELVSSGPVFFFSKTYCDACKDVGEFLLQLGAKYKMVELDVENVFPSSHGIQRPINPFSYMEWNNTISSSNQRLRKLHLGHGIDRRCLGFNPTKFGTSINALSGDGAELQSALAEWTGQRSVPNIFIGGNHIGGKADLMKKHKEGYLITLLTEAGALPSSNPAV